MERRPSPNQDPRPAGTAIDMLVLHYTGMRSADEALERLCDDTCQVSAHYLIDLDGAVFSLVDEDNRAWHAGIAWWRGRADVNARSIGIELVNPGHEFGLAPFPEAQLISLIDLGCDILARHSVPPVNVVGHSDVAPRRKQDPGELFPWSRLAKSGIGYWPGPCEPLRIDQGLILSMLAQIGYETEDWQKSIEAFQRRYRPSAINGFIDGETAALIASVLDSLSKRGI